MNTGGLEWVDAAEGLSLRTRMRLVSIADDADGADKGIRDIRVIRGRTDGGSGFGKKIGTEVHHG